MQLENVQNVQNVLDVLDVLNVLNVSAVTHVQCVVDNGLFCPDEASCILDIQNSLFK